MHAHTFLAALLASTVCAVPSPKVFTSEFWTPDVVHHHGTVIREEPKEQAGVYICEHHSWGGACEHKLSPLGSAPEDCTIIDGTASSIGPDEGYFCIFFTNALCSAVLSDGSQSLTLRYPGSSNLVQTDQGNFNDKLLSYQCFKEEEEVEEPSVPTSSPVTTVIPIPTEAPVVVQPPTEQPFMPTDVLTEELPSPTDVPTKKDPVDETPSSD